ncbi:MaoC/PaaZ C-terminal domain-containing protein [Rhodococcus sp. 2H158]
MSTAAETVRPGFGTPITVERLVRYAGSSGDFNALHYDPEFARAAGFDRPVVVGSLTTALLVSEFLADHDVQDLRRLEVRFLAPVLAGELLSAEFDPAVDEADGTRSTAARVVGAAGPVVDGRLVTGSGPVAAEPLPADFTPLGEPFRWPVEEGHARFFGEAVDSPLSTAAGAPIHPAFLATAMRWSPSSRDFVQRLDFDFTRVVHGSSTLTFTGAPLRVGDELLVTEGHSGRRTVEGRSGVMTMADAHLVVHDTTGAERARLTYRIVERP